MDEKKKAISKRECLVCLLWFCCVLLTLAVFTFSIYTVKEFATIKARIYELEHREQNFIRDNNIDYIEDSAEDSRKVLLCNEEKSNGKKQTTTPGIRLVKKIIRERPTNRSNVFIHLNGGRNIAGANRTDRNLIKRWTVSLSTNQVSYTAEDGSINILVPGFYYIYSQIQIIYLKGENEIKSHETFVNNKRILSSILGNRHKQRKHGVSFETNYQGGIFKLENGDRIFIRGNNRRRWPVKKEANYFGTFMLAETPF